MRLIRSEIPIRLVGGPCDGEKGPPHESDEIEVVRLQAMPQIAWQLIGEADPAQAPALRHRYRRNMSRPWEFDYCP